jgi:hypothetical protein
MRRRFTASPLRFLPARVLPLLAFVPSCLRASSASPASPAHFADAAAAPVRATSSLTALLAGHLLHDGEVVLLVIKPSLWFVLLSSLRWAAVIAILMVAAKINEGQLPGKTTFYVEAGVFVLAGRIMWAVLEWMSRLYVLTDLRILRLAGIFTLDIFDCPLRKIGATRICFTTRERLLRLGSIDIFPSDPDTPGTTWQTIAKPRQVYEQIIATINKAKQCGG